jgi:multiple sugar transport system permease protein
MLLLFEFWPLLFGAWISLWRWDVRPLEFIGLDNYARLFGDGFVTRNFKGELMPGEVASSLLVTVYYVLGTVPIALGLAFVLAYLLFRGTRGGGILRTLYFLPHVTSSVAITIVFAWMFDAKVGVANAALAWLGIPTQRWLQEPTPLLKLLFGLDGVPDWASGPSLALVVVIIFSI